MKIVLQGYETYATITTSITFHKGVVHDVPDEVAADLLTVADASGLPAFVEADAVAQAPVEVDAAVEAAEVTGEQVEGDGEQVEGDGEATASTATEPAEAPAPKGKTVTVGKKASNTVVL